MKENSYICSIKVIITFNRSILSLKNERGYMLKKIILVYGILIILFCVVYKVYFQRVEILQIFNEDSTSKQIDDKEEYVFITFLGGIDYWKRILKGAEDAAETLNVSIKYRSTSQYDVNEQIAILEQVIAKKPAGIAISAIHPEKLNTTIDKAIDSGIPVVLFDSNAPESKAHTYIGTDNYQAGVQAAHKMASLLGGEGNVVIVTSPEQYNHIERVNGFKNTIQNEYQNINIIDTKDSKGNQQIAKNETFEMIQEYKELDGIFVTEANSTIGVGEAIDKLHIENEIIEIGFDTEKETLDMIKDGVIDASISQNTWKMGFWSLQYLYQLKHHTGIGESEVEISTDTGTTIVTKGNVDDFYIGN